MSVKLVFLTSVESDIHPLVQAGNQIREEYGPVMQIVARMKITNTAEI